MNAYIWEEQALLKSSLDAAWKVIWTVGKDGPRVGERPV